MIFGLQIITVPVDYFPHEQVACTLPILRWHPLWVWLYGLFGKAHRCYDVAPRWSVPVMQPKFECVTFGGKMYCTERFRLEIERRIGQ